MPARFHEVSLTTPDIRASLDFYESLGFSQAPTGDAWAHPYAVVTDGRIVLGLHQTPQFGAITFIHPDLTQAAGSLGRTGVSLDLQRTDPEVFNQITFSDPAGQPVRLVAARTFSPADRVPTRESACGYFAHYSMPARDPTAVGTFWEQLGFVAMPLIDEPYGHLGLTSDGITLALHEPRLLPVPALVFCAEDMATTIGHLRERQVPETALPRALAAPGNALLEAPEGPQLLLLTGSV